MAATKKYKISVANPGIAEENDDFTFD